jgi:two-component system response regulator VanR
MLSQRQEIYPLSILLAGNPERVEECLHGCFRSVHRASDTPRAWELYEKHRPDIVLADVTSPGVRGMDLVEKIRHADRNTPIVALGGHCDEALLLRAVTLHLDDFLLKPFSASKLMHAVTRCVRKLRETPESARLTGKLSYCYRSKQLLTPEGRVPLTHREIDLLELLLERRGCVVFYGEIEERVWGAEMMSMDALKSAVKKIRKKMPGGSVVNVRGIGYALE